ncbi:hypothetical protein EK21DRAFT_62252 [Setomelanomma holmii]|uniref:Peptidase A1 domain-containing protein n=1 Tax=Setomelanomma holmii TaxID=210430 RepID=A0A9P4HF60_9PLEO|nr:hypothetical protein EK21DRAFT_62252 [Setomelanomma holmii]
MACPNGSAPLLLPWTNNSISAAGIILSRGISFSIGTLSQSFSLTPSTRSNNLFVNNAAEYTAATNSSCIGQLGGIYSSATSTSFGQVSYGVWEGSRDSVDLASASSYVFFDDAVAFGLKPTANKFTKFPGYTNGSADASADRLMRDEPSSRATLPLGPNSTFLNHLVDSGQASSRTYGLWVGSEFEETPQDGLLVVGGYDSSRLKSAAITFPTYSDCPTCAVLTAITYDIGGKSTALFSATTDKLIVHLDPYSSDLQLPPAMLQNLGAVEKTAVWNATSRRYELPATTAPTGTITVTISDMGASAGDASKPSVATYKTVIPATEFYHRPRAYNAAGVYEVDNATVYNMAVTNQTGSIQFGTLGLPFFKQNYLIVDPDAQNFQLALAVTTAADPKGADAKLKQVCRVLPAGKQKIGIAALAGAVVGSIIGTLLLVALFLFLHKRRRNSKQHHTRAESEVGTATSTNPMYPPTHSTSENESLELPMHAPPPAVMMLRDGTVFPSPIRSSRSTKSRKDKEEDPRRGLAHDVFRKVDEENDGRLLDERPLGLSETIHSKTSLPRVVSEHNV